MIPMVSNERAGLWSETYNFVMPPLGGFPEIVKGSQDSWILDFEFWSSSKFTFLNSIEFKIRNFEL